MDLSIHSEPHRKVGVGAPNRIGLGFQARWIDLTRFAEYGDSMPLNSGRPSGLVKKPSFKEKTRFQGK